MPLGSLISAGGSLLGGLLGKKSADKANAANIAHQKQFAQQGIQWKVADAEKAGVHPLFALGASTHSFSPSSVGDSSLPSAMANMGQDLGRAANAAMSHGERQATGIYTRRMQELQLQRGELENTLLASKIAKLNQVGSVPAVAMPTDGHMIEGQGDVPLFSPDPKVALVNPPDAKVQAGKSFGLAPVRNPRLFSSGQWMEDEFGENPFQHLHGAASYLEAMYRASGHKTISDYMQMKRKLSGKKPPYWRR